MIIEAPPRPVVPGHVTAIVSLSDWVDRVVRALLCFIGGGMALLIGVQVFSRYALNTSIFWAEEVGRMCLVWITFLGATAAYRRHQHVGVDLFVRRMPRRMQVASGLTAWSVSMGLFGVVLFYGIRFLGFVAHQKTAALGLSMVVPYMVIPTSGAVFLLHGLRHLLEQVHGSPGE
jgi:TRAP-type transport system small permease protein